MARGNQIECFVRGEMCGSEPGEEADVAAPSRSCHSKGKIVTNDTNDARRLIGYEWGL